MAWAEWSVLGWGTSDGWSRHCDAAGGQAGRGLFALPGPHPRRRPETHHALTNVPHTCPPPPRPPQAAEREQAQWEDDVAVRRSQGQFFQSLYQPKGKGRAGAAAAGAAAGAADATSREEIKVGGAVTKYLGGVCVAAAAAAAVYLRRWVGGRVSASSAPAAGTAPQQQVPLLPLCFLLLAAAAGAGGQGCGASPLRGWQLAALLPLCLPGLCAGGGGGRRPAVRWVGGWVGISFLSPGSVAARQTALAQPCPPLLLRCIPPSRGARPPTTCLNCCCAAPLAAESPSAMQDVLYTLLVILLGVTAINERKTLL